MSVIKSVSAADDGYMHHISLVLMHAQLATYLQSSMVLNKAVKIMGGIEAVAIVSKKSRLHAKWYF